MISSIRLAFAMQRLELRLLLGAVLLISVAALGLAWQTRVLREEQLACYRGAPGAACTAQDAPLADLDRIGAFVKVGVLGTPIVLGIFLGVPLVAREIEARTAPLAWSLSRSRARWLLRRSAPAIGVLVVACLAVGAAGDVLVHAAPWVEGSDPGFSDWFARGPQVAVRGLAVGAIGLAVGAVLGRQLPAVLLAAVATVALFAGTTIVVDRWMEAAAEPVIVAGDQIVSGKIYDSGLREDATGTLITYEQAYQQFGNTLDEVGIPAGYSQVYFMTPSRRYGEFALYESGLFGAVALVAFSAASLIVVRRRP